MKSVHAKVEILSKMKKKSASPTHESASSKTGILKEKEEEPYKEKRHKEEPLRRYEEEPHKEKQKRRYKEPHHKRRRYFESPHRDEREVLRRAPMVALKCCIPPLQKMEMWSPT
ncbi:hypothetical protein CR513_26534, partial [Mucuna pruriens]